MFFSRVFSFFSNLVKFALFCFFLSFFFARFSTVSNRSSRMFRCRFLGFLAPKEFLLAWCHLGRGGGAGLQESPQPMVVVTYVKNGLKWPEMAKWPKMA